jgi:hypothetical protein
LKKYSDYDKIKLSIRGGIK